jgi:WASH complex subunit strumpellin
MSHKVFTMILQAVGAPGLSGLDKMISHLVAVEMEKVIKFIDKGIKNRMWAAALREAEALFKNGENLKSN